MAIATTATFNPDIGDIIEEAFELCGKVVRSGSDMRTARRSINYLTLEWSNEGLNMWAMEEVTIASSLIVDGTASYDLPADTIAILDMHIRLNSGASTQIDYEIERISQNTYAKIPSKLTEGRPTQFMYNRDGVLDVTTGVDDQSTITLWPIPDETSKYTLVYWRIRRLADAGNSADNTMDIPDRFHPAFVYGLAYRLSVKIAPERTQMLGGEYRELFNKATEEDREKVDLRIVPDLTGY
jgi:hypothetical protein